ncbi:MAG: PEGA domain-containing protein [Myxococcales bacterium]
MRNALFALLSLLCLVPATASAKDDGFTTDEEVLDGKAPAGSKPKPKKKPDGSAPTHAGELPQGPLAVVIVAKDPGATETAVAFEAAVTRFVDSDGRLSSVDLLKVLGGEPTRAETPNAAIESFKKGKDAYDNLDPEGAAKEFMEGLKVLAGDPATASPPKIARALTWVGAAHLINGDNAKAADSFTRATVMSPAYQPDPNEFSPDILAAFKEAKDKVAAGPKGDLTVSSNASPTYVTVDEVERGVAPVTIKGLPAGRHHVVVKSRGHQPWATFVEVQGNGGTTASADLKTLPQADRFRKAVEIAQTELEGDQAGLRGSGDCRGPQRPPRRHRRRDLRRRCWRHHRARRLRRGRPPPGHRAEEGPLGQRGDLPQRRADRSPPASSTTSCATTPSGPAPASPSRPSPGSGRSSAPSEPRWSRVRPRGSSTPPSPRATRAGWSSPASPEPL